jgi:hypothetical protein
MLDLCFITHSAIIECCRKVVHIGALLAPVIISYSMKPVRAPFLTV